MNNLINFRVKALTIVAILLVTMVAQPCWSQLVLEPGEIASNLIASHIEVIDCQFPNLHGCYQDFELSHNLIKSSMQPSVGNAQSRVSISTKVSVASADFGEEHNLVGSFVSVKISTVGQTSAGGIGCMATHSVTFEIKDLTTSTMVGSSRVNSSRAVGGISLGVPPVPTQSTNRVISTDQIVIPVPLTTGHTYRLKLSLDLFAEKIGIGPDQYSFANFANRLVDDHSVNPDWAGVKWSELNVTVGQDHLARIDELREAIEKHAHTYLTGKGVGHNNTEATTGLAIFFDDSTITTEEIFIFPEEDIDLSYHPTLSKLYPNYPNPFNPTTNISYSIPEPSHVSIKIYNVLGQVVEKLVDKPMNAGNHEVVFDASNLASGVYFYKLTTESYTESRKLMLIK